MIFRETKLHLLFILLFIFFSNKSFSQNYSVKINWKQNVKVIDEDVQINMFNFSNVIQDKYFVPYYSNQINIKSQYNKSFQFNLKPKNIKFIVLPETEIPSSINKNKIPNDFVFKSETLFARGIPFINYSIAAIRKNKKNGNYEKLISFDLEIDKKRKVNKSNKQHIYASNSILNSGTWKKIKISKSGIYKLTFQELESIGISNPQNVRIFGNATGWLPMIAGDDRPDDLVENDILIENNSVIFYAQGPDRWDYDEANQEFKPKNHYYSDFAYYYITSDVNTSYNNSIKIENQSTLAETDNVTTYNSYAVHEKDEYNIAETGRVWYGEAFEITNNQNFTLSFPNLVDNSQAKLVVYAASTSSTSYFKVDVNGTSKNITFSYISSYDVASRANTELEFTTNTSDEIKINLNYISSTPSARAWLDYLYVNAISELRFSGSQMQFRNASSVGAGNVTKYNIANASGVTIWDITDKTKPKKVNTTAEGASLTFKLESSTLKEFIAFNGSDYLKPDLTDVKDVANQNLHATSGSTDMIIVTYPEFLPQANEIKKLHETLDNMSVKVVTLQQVYNEFSCGATDFSAIRDYAKMVYDRATSNDTLRYLMLLGDGSYDNRSGEGVNGNYVITYQQEYSEGLGGSKVTDDYFGLLDDNEGDYGIGITGKLDIGIGRLIVNSVQEANEHIAKIKNYVSSQTFGDWRNQLCFVADDFGEDGYIHTTQTETLTNYIDENYPVFNIQKIYLDAYKQYTEAAGERYPDVNNAINSRMQKGTLIFHYTGHGGEHGLAHERVVTISEIQQWQNFEKLPLFVTATCEFTRFDDYKFKSAGEYVFTNPHGGAVAIFTTARIAWIYSNGQLTEELYKHMFESFEDGDRLRLGDIIRLTKCGSFSNNNLIFFLMGDPALRLGYASENKIVTKLINNAPISEVDTLKALNEVSFTGELQDKNGNKLTNFNGYVYPTIYDKIRSVTTQNNDDYEAGPYTYKTRDNVIYKGKASVTNGDFSFKFIVPKDIALNVDTGKISYYAENGLTDAKGYSFDFLVGDIASNYEEDNKGPEISLYMNDENFVSGGITNSNPRIYAILSDEHGINTATGGIGHDITAIIDDDLNNIIVMNDDYRADEGTYKTGKLEHFLFNIEQGNHKLKFKAWDVYNNSSEEYLEFLVIEADNLSIDRLLNYPNPFTTHTDFYFEHNQAGSEIDVLIQIFTISGKLVKTIDASYFADGNRAGPFAWDGTDDFGNKIGRGVYVYRVKLRSQTGEVAEKFEKLLILK
ncbi:MAG: type IX secretion system sortase PorU [Chlorobi bacterium]|nr:type IX secretion system sortase PorU [Chlorobiota bacterium]